MTQSSLQNFTDRIKKNLTLLLAIYIFISLLYQASVFWWNPIGYSEIKYFEIGPCYQFRIRYPHEVPLATAGQISLTNSDRISLTDPDKIPIIATAGKEYGRAITIWGWKDNNDSDCDVYSNNIKASFGDDGRLVFVSADNIEINSSLNLTLGNSESDSVRKTIYVYAPLTNEQYQETYLKVSLQNFRVSETVPFLVHFQSTFNAIMFRFLDIIFGIPLITLVAAMVATLEFYFKQRDEHNKRMLEAEDRRKQSIKDFENELSQLESPVGQIGEKVVDLYDRAKELGQSYEEILRMSFENLHNKLVFGDIWSYTLRQKIIAKLSTRGDISAWLKDSVFNIRYLPIDKIAINKFIEIIKSNNITPSINNETLKIILNVFRILGKESTGFIINLIKSIMPQNLDEVAIMEAGFKEEWYKGGGATGRYLLYQLEHADLQSKFKEWLQNTPLPPNRVKPSYGLWPEKIHFQVPYAKIRDLSPNAEWAHPFGPLKAEADPRLPRAESDEENSHKPIKGMFYDGHSLWSSSILQPDSALYVAPSGFGTSAFILMGRNNRRLWGPRPSLSIYLPLFGVANADKIWDQLHQELAHSLFIALVEDPSWLLNAPIEMQEHVSVFLKQWSGDFQNLMRRLHDAGMPINDQVLVADFLYSYSYQETRVKINIPLLLERVASQMAESASYRNRDGRFDVYFWAELGHTPSTDDWISLFVKEGINNFGVLKVFSHVNLQKKENALAAGLDIKEIKWNKEDLAGLLNHRVVQSGWAEKNAWDVQMKISKDELLDRATGSPRELIRIGNIELFGNG